MSNRWIINRPPNFQSSISHWLSIEYNLAGTQTIPNGKKRNKDFFGINVTIKALIIHDLLPGRHSTVVAFLNKDTDSNSQESKTDKSTFWKFCFWYFSYCPPDKSDLSFCFRHGLHIGCLHASSIPIWLLLSSRNINVNFYHRKKNC